MDTLSTANVEFCLDVFKELSSNHVGENVFFSPVSLLYALSMLFLGARGNSAAQMGKVLHFSYVEGSSHPGLENSSKCDLTGGIHLELPALFSQISRSDSNSTLGIANKLYGTKNIEFHPGRIVPVQMMHQIGTFKVAFIKELQMQILELPYASGNLSMIVLLPKDTDQIEQIEKQLNLKTFNQWTNSLMTEREVDVLFPRFKLGIKYELNSLLKALGITDIFDNLKADLSGLSPSRELYLSKVIHESFVDVNEEGTEASAATGDVVVVKRLPIRDRFIADHPFLFFIKHIYTNTILFCGRFSSP
ncbi:serpin B11 isoform X2 [Gracilinanus agilis]|uniref:serpin B11 isoform X2 n=1 Tax=Gracilinanus agilis TaxID=191870 RepID=UPI001CFDEBEC|nr:serpin B11 isoform X2 [Gracilinanus agilis]